MATKPIAAGRDHATDPLLERMQARVRELVTAVRRIPYFLGRPVAVHFAAASTRQIVTHKLGVAASCFPIRLNYDAAQNKPSFCESNDQSGIDKTNQLALQASAVCTTVFWFYPRIDLPIPNGKTQSE